MTDLLPIVRRCTKYLAKVRRLPPFVREDVASDVVLSLIERPIGEGVDAAPVIFNRCRWAFAEARRRADRSARYQALFPEFIRLRVFTDGVLDGLVADAITSVPRGDLELLALLYIDGLSNDEVGELLGISGSRVSHRRTRALARIRQICTQGMDAANGIPVGRAA